MYLLYQQSSISPPSLGPCAANSESIVPGAERLIANMRLPQSPPLTLQIPLQDALCSYSFLLLFNCISVSYYCEPKTILQLKNMQIPDWQHASSSISPTDTTNSLPCKLLIVISTFIQPYFRLYFNMRLPQSPPLTLQIPFLASCS